MTASTESSDRRLRHEVRREAIKRLIEAHPEEFEQLKAEEWTRLRPEKPTADGNRKAELPVEKIVQEYEDGASLRVLAKKYGVARSTLQAHMPKEVLRPPGRRKGDGPLAPRRFSET